MEYVLNILGIDVSKNDFHVALVSERGEHKRVFPNSTVGFRQLDAWLRNRKAETVAACMEATGSYWEALALHLHEQRHRVSVVNPSRIKAYAQSELLRTKTDAVDAGLIARFAAAQQPDDWQPPAPEVRLLQDLSRHLDALKQDRAEHLTRLQTPGLSAVVTESTQKLIHEFDKRIAAIETAIDEHIDCHPDLRRKRDLLMTIKGVGKTTAAVILSEAPNLENFKNARAVAAFAGLSPQVFQSGSSVRRKARLCKTGNSRLRKALYFPALTARWHNPVLRAFAERLAGTGKPPMVIIGAVMRKLLVLAYGVLKSGIAFNPALVQT